MCWDGDMIEEVQILRSCHKSLPIFPKHSASKNQSEVGSGLEKLAAQRALKAEIIESATTNIRDRRLWHVQQLSLPKYFTL